MIKYTVKILEKNYFNSKKKYILSRDNIETTMQRTKDISTLMTKKSF